jgi:hypothetical protein
MLSKAYDLADPKLVFGVNGDISEAAGEGDEGTSRAVFRESKYRLR